ncbi:MAG: VOC family protein [Oxalobacteraceae bacterium]|nr:MAG: VOC family protein [Oxalobacteraceae bacterium]
MATPFTPPDRSTVSPYLLVGSVTDALIFLDRVFSAVELHRVAGENGSIRHAEVRIGDSVLMLGERPGNAMPASVHVYVPNVDETYQTAIAAGASSLSEPRDLPYGDRSAGVRDPQGNLWWLGTHIGEPAG